MATQSIHLPEELFEQAERLAQAQGRTTDDLAADALKRYMSHELLASLSSKGEEHRRSLGLKTDEDVERYVGRIITEHRQERRRG